MLRRSRHFPSSGFTLSELLVVMVIVAIVAVLSLLGIGRMRNMADATGVVSSGGVPNARHARSVSTVTEPSQSMDKREGKTNTGDLACQHGDKIIVPYFDGRVGELSKFDVEEIDKTKDGARSAFR